MLKTILILFSLVSIQLIILFSFQFTAWPEMYSYAYLYNKGFVLYRDFALPYQPLLVFILSPIYQIFGYDVNVLRIFTYVVIIVNDLLIFYISYKLLPNNWKRFLPIVIYILLQPLFDGNELWFDLASTPFILLGLASLLFFKRANYQYIFLGLFFSLSFFVKQQQGILILMVFLLLCFQKNWKNLFYYVLGGLLPGFLVLIYITYNGLLSDFIFWTVEVPIAWYPKMPGYATPPTIKQSIVALLIFGSVFIISLSKFLKKDLFTKIVIFSFISTFLIAFPRFAFFRLQPALAVFMILLIIYLEKTNRLKIILLIPIFIAIVVLFRFNLRFVDQDVRFYSSSDISFANYVGQESIGKSVYFLGPHSLNYIISDTVPPKPWVDNFIWYMEIPGIQDKMIKGLERERPAFIYRSIPYGGEWFGLGTYQPKKIVEFISQNYNRKKTLDNGVEVWQIKD